MDTSPSASPFDVPVESSFQPPIPAIVVIVVCLVVIIISALVLVLLLKKTKRRTVLIRAPDVENPHYNHLTIRSETTAGRSNVLKRLSQRIINRFSVYSQSDTLTRQSGTLTRNTATLTRQRNTPTPPPSPKNTTINIPSPQKFTTSLHFSFVEEATGDYENTTPNSTTSIQPTLLTAHVHKRDNSEIYCIPVTDRPYSQLQIPVYSDSLQDGSIVPTEDERNTSLCEHFVKSGHLYNKFQFFEQSDDFWFPASTTSGLYTQLSIRKYRELSKDQIKIHSHLGSGNFATVSKGEWVTQKRTLEVAVKILQAGSKVMDKIKFLQEAAIMGQFCHPNIVRLHGVVTLGEPTMIVLELLSKGDLLTYLNRLNPSPDPREQDPLQRLFIKFAREIASGMEHLSKKRFIHRDLAARNILLSEDMTCKIGDFGMARNLLDEDYYCSRGGKIPVKWTAPEALLYKKYSTNSDVWSYGILLYEMWSLGKKPFPDLSIYEMITQAGTGLCHTPSPGLPRSMYILMVDCWNPQHSKRPDFDKIHNYLSQSESLLLHWSDKDLSLSPLVHILGTSLNEAQGLYKDLQLLYRQNEVISFTKARSTSEKHNRNRMVNDSDGWNKIEKHSSL